MQNIDLSDEDKDYFYKLYFDVRKMYNILLKKNGKDNSECRDEALDIVLCNGTDLLFFEEYIRHKNMKMKDLFIEL